MFEAGGAVLAWYSAWLVWCEPAAGVSWLLFAWSFAWAVECVPYYLHHRDRTSATFAIVRCAGLAAWCYLAARRWVP